MNSLPQHLTTGTFGELLVQLRLLQYEVQAAPPLRDSGNDLIAIKGPTFKAVQVKTTATDRFSPKNMPHCYHLVALVALVANGSEVDLQGTQVFLLPREEFEKSPTHSVNSLKEWTLCAELVQRLFAS